MSFQALAIRALTQIYAAFAEDVTYIPAGRPPKTVRAIVDFGPEEILDDSGVKIQVEQRRISVLTSEVTDPQRGDVFRVRGGDYHIARIEPENDGERDIILEDYE